MAVTYVDAVYCYRPSSVVCRSVSKPCKNGWTDRDVVWTEDSGGPRELCTRWGSRYPMESGNFEGGKGVPLSSTGTLRGHLCKNGWTNRDDIWIVGLDGPKE